MNTAEEILAHFNLNLKSEVVKPCKIMCSLIYKAQIEMDDKYTAQQKLIFISLKNEWSELVKKENMSKEFDYAGELLNALEDIKVIKRVSGGIRKNMAGFMYVLSKESFKGVQEMLLQHKLIEEEEISKAETNIRIFSLEEEYSSVNEIFNKKINVEGSGFEVGYKKDM